MMSEFKTRPLTAALAAALLSVGSSAALAQDSNEAEEDQNNEPGEIETVVVTGSRIEQNIEDVAGSISVMSGEDIDAQMVTDMSQMFRYEPGVNITGSNGTAQNFIVRGMGGDRVMMIKDGMRMNEGYGADGANDVVGRGFVDMDTIKQVEVAKGAASSLYGADAMGGIVAFVTRDAGDFLNSSDYHASVNADYDGRSDTTGAGALGAFRTGGFETLISYKARRGHETQNYEDNRRDTDVDSDSLLLKTDYVFDENRVLTFSIDAYRQDVERPDTGGDKGTYVGLPGWTINTEMSKEEKENDSYKLRYRDVYSGSSWVDSIDLNIYLNETEQSDEYLLNHDMPPPMGPGGSRDIIKSDLFEQETWGVSLSMGKQLELDTTSHFLSYGFDWDSTDTRRPREEQRILDDGTVTVDDLSAPFPKNTTDRLGIYLQDSIEISDKFTLVPGVRYDDYEMKPKEDEGYRNSVGDNEDVAVENVSDDDFSFRLGAIYDFTDDFSAYFQYAQGFKVPPYDLAYFYFDHVSFSGNGIRIIPATDLVPEESDSYEIGIRGTYGDFSYNLSAYRSDYDDFIQIGYVETIDEINWDFGFPFPIAVDVFQYENIDEAEISGVEFRLDYDLNDNMSMFLNGEWMDSEDKSTGEQLASIQPFNGTLGFRYFKGQLALDAMLRWVDDMTDTPDDAMQTDSYTTLDLFARYELNEHLQFSLGLLNAFDEDYIEYTSVDDGRDLTLYSEPGRTVSASLRYSF
jgi:hemoglobin/transferrin/lactoferrin receptor protein